MRIYTEFRVHSTFICWGGRGLADSQPSLLAYADVHGTPSNTYADKTERHKAGETVTP